MPNPDGTPTREELYLGAPAMSSNVPASLDVGMSYYGGQPTVSSPPPIPVDPPGAAPFQPNPGLPGYNPNPSQAPTTSLLSSGVTPLRGGTVQRFGERIPSAVTMDQALRNEGPGMQAGPQEELAFVAKETPQVRNPVEVARDTGGSSGARVGGGYGGGSDPFGVGKAEKHLLGTYGREAELIGQGGELTAKQAATRAEGMSRAAKERMEDAEILDFERRVHSDTIEKNIAQVRSEIQAVREQKIDPNRLMSDTGSKILAVVGGLIGGLYQGAARLEKNPFLEDLNRKISEDIRIQENEIGRKAKGLDDELNLISQLRATYKDDEMARLQARNLHYEGVKQAIEAEAAQFDSPMALQHAQMGINGVTREQAKLEKQIAERNQQMAAAAAAVKRAELEKEREWKFKWAELGVKAEEAAAKSGEAAAKVGEREEKIAARFVPTGKDPATGAPTGYVTHGDGPEALAHRKQTENAQKMLSALDRIEAIRREHGTLERVGGVTSFLFTPKWQKELTELQNDLLTYWKTDKELGALSKSDLGLAETSVPKMDSVFSGSDQSVANLRSSINRGLGIMAQSAAGTRGTLAQDPKTGAVKFVPTGGFEAPNNPKGSQGVNRTPVK